MASACCNYRKPSYRNEDPTQPKINKFKKIKININIYAPNIGAPQYIKQLLTALKEEIDSNTIIVGDFNTSLTPMDRSSK